MGQPLREGRGAREAQVAVVTGSFDFEAALDFDFVTREVECGKCANHCEIICVYRDDELIDAWGNRCEKGEVRAKRK